MKLLRQEIDRIDTEIQRLFEERMEISGKIGQYKASHGMPVFDAAREDAKIEHFKESASSEENAKWIEQLYLKIFEISRSRQDDIVNTD